MKACNIVLVYNQLNSSAHSPVADTRGHDPSLSSALRLREPETPRPNFLIVLIVKPPNPPNMTLQKGRLRN